MISRDVIETIRERIDIVDVISQTVTLKRAGSSLKGLCPFHQEKSPSFNVVPHKKIWHCFGCQEGGDVFKFVEKTRGLPFIDVVRELAAQAGVQLEEERLSPDQRRARNARASLYDVCELAADWFHSNLMTRADGRVARDYLKGRGLTQDTVERYRVGFVPEGWDGLINHLHGRGVSADQAVLAGLAKRSDRPGGGAYDAFRGRIIIPIEDPRGRIVAFGGRTMPGGRADAPKYINSPETPIYKKSAVLYGLRHARAAVQRKNRMLVVEGYFDVISLHQAGFQEAVATCGTALTPEHVRIIRPLTRTVVALFDSDAAGERAAARSMEVFLEAGIEPRRLTLQGAKDPDEFVLEHGPDAFEHALERSEPLFELLLRRSVERHGTTPGGRAAVLRELAPVVRLHPPESRAPLAARLGSALWMDPRAVRETIGRAPRPEVSAPQATSSRWRGTVELNHLLWLLLHFPNEITDVMAGVDPGLVTDRDTVIQAMAWLMQGRLLPDVIESADDPDLARVLLAAAAREGLYTEEQARPAARQILDRLQENQLRADLARFKHDLATCGPEDDVSRLKLLRQIQALQRQLKHLRQRRPSEDPP